MAKIIKVTETDVTIARDDQSFITVEKSTLTFFAEVGMEVEVFEMEDEIIVNRVTAKDNLQDKININITNTNANANVNTVMAVPYGAKSVNKWLYVALAIFLGSIGVHHFYAGKIMKGILYFVFCWTFIPALIALFEGLSAAFRPADAAGKIWV